ncbi:MAG: dTDP-4-dehydrorhamnose 3,5-epimerase family protein [bacterium]|nr:dTDP-4-dehydrorhamnose 3,5-epimerase family protein [bacterium]
MNGPQIISGDLAVDDRGLVRFINAFRFQDVKRFYCVENFSLDTVRAFHGHQHEAKHITVVRGSAIIAAVPFDDPRMPRKDVPVERFIVSAAKPAIVSIPPRYANGFKALEQQTVLLVFSTATVEESKTDDYRFPADYWGTQVWEVPSR